MSTMLHEMAAVIADEIGAAPQVEGEDDSHFIIIDMFYSRPGRGCAGARNAIGSIEPVGPGAPWFLPGPAGANLNPRLQQPAARFDE